MSKTQDNSRFGADLCELAAAGSTVSVAIPEENAKVEICQVGGVHESTVFELPDGRTGYILDLEITNQTTKTIYCSDTELRTQWEDASFDWLPDPEDTGRTVSYFVKKNGRRERVDIVSECYCFSGSEQLEYPRELVLNHVLLKGCALQPGYPLKGLLLAIGGPMPRGLRHGQWLEPTLALIASDHREYTAEIQLWTQRLELDERKATRMPNLYRAPHGFQAGSPAVVGNQQLAHAEKPRSPDTDRGGRISL